MLKDGSKLYSLYKNKEISKTEKLKLLSRMLKEQGKSSKHISSNSLQNPIDSDTAYRKKGKKKRIGCTANMLDKLNDNNFQITCRKGWSNCSG